MTTPKSITLHEVICDHPRIVSAPYGMTFHNEADAEAYAHTMRAHDYRATVSPPFGTEATLASALANAAFFFRDEKLKAIAK